MGLMPSSSRTGGTGAPGYQSSEWEARLERASAYALYLHVPFCAQKCAYCDFASWTTRRDDPLMSSYAAALASQIDEARGLGLLEGLETAYIGGGTPSLLGAESLGAIVRNVASLGPAELSCEANPDSLTDEVLDAAREAGATRLSIGVQSLVDSELRKLGRLHDAALAQDRVRAAVAQGDVVDIAFTPQINEYRSMRSVQLNLVDIRPDKAFREAQGHDRAVYKKHLAGGELSCDEAECLLPTRQDFVAVWRYLAAFSQGGVLSEELGCLSRKISRCAKLSLSAGKTRICLDVLAEQGLLQLEQRPKSLCIRMCADGRKVDLEKSPILIHLKKQKAGT